VVPAHAFGQSFTEWREWNPSCIDSKWNSFKWRNCASKVNQEYRYMESDMYNLVPSIWSINALRSNYSFVMIPGETREFWTCDIEIQDQKVEPKEEIRWDIARIYMYMDLTYPDRWIISEKNKKLYDVWNREDVVSEKECERYKSIKAIQGNENVILAEACK
jgi:deoxyribonuclease-1